MSKKLIDHSVRDGDKCSSNANAIANYLEDQVGQLTLLLSAVLHTSRIIRMVKLPTYLLLDLSSQTNQILSPASHFNKP